MLTNLCIHVTTPYSRQRIFLFHPLQIALFQSFSPEAPQLYTTRDEFSLFYKVSMELYRRVLLCLTYFAQCNICDIHVALVCVSDSLWTTCPMLGADSTVPLPTEAFVFLSKQSLGLQEASGFIPALLPIVELREF